MVYVAVGDAFCSFSLHFPYFLQRFKSLCALRVYLEHVLEGVGSFFKLLKRLVDATEAEVRINICVVEADRILIVLYRLLILAQVIVRAREIEVTFW